MALNENKILLINDVTGYGRVSSFAMMPILSSYGLHPYVLPTSIVSNTMDYGSCEILDTTDFMRNTIAKWNEYNFMFNTICTGFINSSEQVDIILNLIKSQDSPFVMVDPIMAEDGKLYPGMYKNAVECNKKLISKSNLCIPNLTEAEMLADLYIGSEALSDIQYNAIINSLLDLGAKDIIITSCKDKNGRQFNLIYNNETGSIQKFFYENYPAKFIGTGDVFSATVISELINNNSLFDSVKEASNLIYKILQDNKENSDRFDLYIENSLKHINK